jgi:hypothetical protein
MPRALAKHSCDENGQHYRKHKSEDNHLIFPILAPRAGLLANLMEWAVRAFLMLHLEVVLSALRHAKPSGKIATAPMGLFDVMPHATAFVRSAANDFATAFFVC